MTNTQAIEHFVEKMKERLEANKHFDNYYCEDGALLEEVDGWLKDEADFEHLLSKMAEHCGEINSLMRLLVNGGGKEKLIVLSEDIDRLVKQCADCANFSMMIADRALRRKKEFKPPLKAFVVD